MGNGDHFKEGDWPGWLRAGLERASVRGVTHRTLGAALGKTHSIVKRLLSGEQSIKMDEAVIISQYLDWPLPWWYAGKLSVSKQTVAGVRIVGTVGIGVWREGESPGDFGTCPTVRSDIPLEDQTAYIAETPFPHLGVPRGGMVVTVSSDKYQVFPGTTVVAATSRGSLHNHIICQIEALPEGYKVTGIVVARHIVENFPVLKSE